MDDRPDFLNAVGEKARQFLLNEAEWVSISAGETLFSMNEPADALYLLLSGSLGVYVPGMDDAQRLVAVIRHGETVGEMGIISNQPRSATIVAIRDCDLMKLGQAKFDYLLRREPEVLAGLNRLLVHRLRQSMHGSNTILEPKTVALLPCCKGVDVAPVAKELIARLQQQKLKAKFIDERDADRSSRWFTEQEDLHDHVLLCAQSGGEEWIKVCARQADRVLVISPTSGAAKTDLPQGLLEQRAEHQLLDLVLLYEAGETPADTGRWRNTIPVNRHFHIRRNDDKDWGRLARVIGGRGVGVVLGGGGARAYAHIGVLHAFEDEGVPIDFYGGTSMGGIIAAGRAMGWSIAELSDRIRRTFVESNPLSDYALPIISLVRGEKVKRLLRDNFGDVQIQDTWLPFFCVSSNLTTARSVAHKNGDLVQALRASIALPGILPPIITSDGVFADGAVLNNLPVDAMRGVHRGPIAAIDVARDLALHPDALRQEIESRSLRRWFRPPIISVLMRAGTVTSEQQNQQQAADADLVVSPALGNIEIRDWKAFDAAVEIGYKYGREALAQHGHKLRQRRRVAIV